MSITQIILGVDPGIHGGLAIVHAVIHANTATVLLHDAVDIPTVGTGAGERVDVTAVCTWIGQHRPTMALIERAQALPAQGASSGFKYGRAVGALEAAIVTCEVPIEIIEPATWKRFFRLPGKDKERSRQRAIQLFPAAHAMLARKRDHGRAEAALIALYGVRKPDMVAPVPELRIVS
jgi:crossover junction endodeoxyribonuclease RuvC